MCFFAGNVGERLVKPPCPPKHSGGGRVNRKQPQPLTWGHTGACLSSFPIWLSIGLVVSLCTALVLFRINLLLEHFSFELDQYCLDLV